jgi:hypothetical protein
MPEAVLTPVAALAPKLMSSNFDEMRESMMELASLGSQQCVIIHAIRPYGHTHRVGVEIMGSHKLRIVGKSQSHLIMINPIIFTRTRRYALTTSKGQMSDFRRRCGVRCVLCGGRFD